MRVVKAETEGMGHIGSQTDCICFFISCFNRRLYSHISFSIKYLISEVSAHTVLLTGTFSESSRFLLQNEVKFALLQHEGSTNMTVA